MLTFSSFANIIKKIHSNSICIKEISIYNRTFVGAFYNREILRGGQRDKKATLYPSET